MPLSWLYLNYLTQFFASYPLPQYKAKMAVGQCIGKTKTLPPPRVSDAAPMSVSFLTLLL